MHEAFDRLDFDEVITGFRISYEGAAGYYGIVPDLACFGKIIGAGFPVGAYGGKKEIMACVSPSGPVYQAGTLSGNPLAMQAGKVMLDYLKHNPAVYDLIEEKGAYLQAHFQKILDANRLPFTLVRNHSLMTLFLWIPFRMILKRCNVAIRRSMQNILKAC